MALLDDLLQTAAQYLAVKRATERTGRTNGAQKNNNSSDSLIQISPKNQRFLDELAGGHVRGENEGLVGLPEILRREKPSALTGLAAVFTGPLALPYLASPTFRKEIDAAAQLPGPTAMVVGGGSAMRSLTQTEITDIYTSLQARASKWGQQGDDIAGEVVRSLLEKGVPQNVPAANLDAYVNTAFVEPIALEMMKGTKASASKVGQLDESMRMFHGTPGAQQASSAHAASQQEDALISAIESGTVEAAAGEGASSLATGAQEVLPTKISKDLANKLAHQGRTWREIAQAKPKTYFMNDQLANTSRKLKQRLGVDVAADLPIFTPDKHLASEGHSPDAIRKAIKDVIAEKGNPFYTPAIRRAAEEYLINGKSTTKIAKAIGYKSVNRLSELIQGMTNEVYAKLGTPRVKVKLPITKSVENQARGESGRWVKAEH